MTSLLSGPPRVIYIDLPDSWYPYEDLAQTINSAVDAGFNVINLAFWTSTDGPVDMCSAWETDVGSVAGLQESTVKYANDRGAIVLASAGGATDTPWNTLNGIDYGTGVANFAVQNNLNGVDFDIENFSVGFIMFGGSTTTETVKYLVDATNAAKAILGDSRFITHAPLAPYFGPQDASYWAGSLGGYSEVYRQAGSQIDFFNIQYQGETMYVDYPGLYVESGGDFPGTSVGEITTYGVPLEKLIVGKPLRGEDADNGYVDPTTLGIFIASSGAPLGVMTWQYPGLTAWPSQGGGYAAAWLDLVFPQNMSLSQKRRERDLRKRNALRLRRGAQPSRFSQRRITRGRAQCCCY